MAHSWQPLRYKGTAASAFLRCHPHSGHGRADRPLQPSGCLPDTGPSPCRYRSPVPSASSAARIHPPLPCQPTDCAVQWQGPCCRHIHRQAAQGLHWASSFPYSACPAGWHIPIQDRLPHPHAPIPGCPLPHDHTSILRRPRSGGCSHGRPACPDY